MELQVSNISLST